MPVSLHNQEKASLLLGEARKESTKALQPDTPSEPFPCPCIGQPTQGCWGSRQSVGPATRATRAWPLPWPADAELLGEQEECGPFCLAARGQGLPWAHSCWEMESLLIQMRHYRQFFQGSSAQSPEHGPFQRNQLEDSGFSLKYQQ